ncbi:hypothetical protein EPUS_03508 [Endocarpon pusillum Z07020]|uniref:Uncharacterized protein n=1 Tax=Endocarpon pusillum (strain Z07020 / HMAS-L-300199) TaxID=1263415 RepID=U1GGW4_ENDPU|nr:uncharacterized protein EPUS_03508 [Endocarpon pusillum Z07020]ERF71353.1 hypothetical protein EPUS_03508 [Endocarpon pusillum Z07020]
MKSKTTAGQRSEYDQRMDRSRDPGVGLAFAAENAEREPQNRFRLEKKNLVALRERQERLRDDGDRQLFQIPLWLDSLQELTPNGVLMHHKRTGSGTSIDCPATFPGM